jgi:hypothetical protein
MASLWFILLALLEFKRGCDNGKRCSGKGGMVMMMTDRDSEMFEAGYMKAYTETKTEAERLREALKKCLNATDAGRFHDVKCIVEKALEARP